MEAQLKEILNQIISKGGLLGSCGKKCVGNKARAEQFIRECGEQTQHITAHRLWGEQLIAEINEYCMSLNKKQKALQN